MWLLYHRGRGRSTPCPNPVGGHEAHPPGNTPRHHSRLRSRNPSNAVPPVTSGSGHSGSEDSLATKDAESDDIVRSRCGPGLGARSTDPGDHPTGRPWFHHLGLA